MLANHRDNTRDKAGKIMSAFSALGQLLRLCRLYYGIPLAGGFLVIVLYLRGGTFAGLQAVVPFAYLSLFFSISAGYIINDICDITVDRINAPTRPLAGGLVSLRLAKYTAATLLLSALVCASYCGLWFTVAIAVINSLLLAYNKYSKQMAFMKDLIIAALLAGLYPLSFALVDPIDSPRLIVLYVHPVWLFLTVLGYEMLKDIRDQSGDIIIGGKNRKISQKKHFLFMARFFIITGAIITILPPVMSNTGIIYLTGAILAVILAVLAVFVTRPERAISYIYIQIAVITAGSLLDILA